MLLHDNARPYSARITQENIFYLVLSVLHHPSYSPDLALSDFSPFHSLQNAMTKNFEKNQQAT